MSLKIIPVEEVVDAKNKSTVKNAQKKPFNPAVKIHKKRGGGQDWGIKAICLRLIHFINRGGHFTYEQVDDIIVSMHHGILRLQKKRQEILKDKGSKKKRK